MTVPGHQEIPDIPDQPYRSGCHFIRHQVVVEPIRFAMTDAGVEAGIVAKFLQSRFDDALMQLFFCLPALIERE